MGPKILTHGVAVIRLPYVAKIKIKIKGFYSYN